MENSVVSSISPFRPIYPFTPLVQKPLNHRGRPDGVKEKGILMTTIVLKIDDEKRRGTLADTLREEKFNVVDAAGDSAMTMADAILADHSTGLDSVASRDAAADRAHVGLAAIGWEGPADVVLPDDVSDRELKLVCSLLAEITRLRRESSRRFHERTEMQQLAFSDSLTAVPNRRGWDQEAECHFEHACVTGRPLAIAIIDLDHFKSVNDQYGHGTGDEVLRSAARAIAASVRSSDYLARLGGDEFGLLLPDVATTALPSVMERVRRAIAAHCSRPVGPNVSASIGYSMRHEETKLSQLFERCDIALRQAKSSGRDRATCG
jgi:diguanylate cyclase (GGDEF)-like protein